MEGLPIQEAIKRYWVYEIISDKSISDEKNTRTFQLMTGFETEEEAENYLDTLHHWYADDGKDHHFCIMKTWINKSLF